MSRKLKERLQIVGIVIAAIAFVAGMVFLVNSSENRRQSQMEWDVACQELGGRIFSNAEDKCVDIQPDGTLGIVLTRQQFENNLKEL